jgi:hypothetical protein
MTKQFIRRIAQNNQTFWAKWNQGFKNHCYLMAQNWKSDDKWASSGAAQIAKEKKDLI